MHPTSPRLPAIAALFAAAAITVAPADVKDAARKVYTDHPGALLNLTATIEMELFLKDAPEAIRNLMPALPKQTQEITVPAANTSPDGVFIVPALLLDMASAMDGRTQNTPMGKITMGARSSVLEASVTTEDGDEIEVEPAYTDPRRGVTVLLPKTKPADPLDHLTFSAETPAPQPMDDLVLFLRMSGKFADHNAMSSTVFTHKTSGPVKFMLTSSSIPGAAVLGAAGQPVGFTVIPEVDTSDDTQPVPVVLPNNELLKVLEKAKATKAETEAPQ